jgi:hypothetical protein
VGIFRYPIDTSPDGPSIHPNQFFSLTILFSTCITQRGLVLTVENSCHSISLTNPRILTAKSQAQHSAKQSVLQENGICPCMYTSRITLQNPKETQHLLRHLYSLPPDTSLCEFSCHVAIAVRDIQPSQQDVGGAMTNLRKEALLFIFSRNRSRRKKQQDSERCNLER